MVYLLLPVLVCLSAAPLLLLLLSLAVLTSVVPLEEELGWPASSCCSCSRTTWHSMSERYGDASAHSVKVAGGLTTVMAAASQVHLCLTAAAMTAAAVAASATAAADSDGQWRAVTANGSASTGLVYSG